MNVSGILKHITQKQSDLDNLALYLKSEFIGLDNVIDEFISSIKVWYIMPELQIRPTCVNIWGLTGTGKTDLVRKMVSYLKMQDRFLEIEMSGLDDSTLTIQKKLEESSLASDDHCILFLDEFQKFRTVGEDGTTNTHSSAFSDVWTLLSDGKFHSDLSRKTELIEELLYAKYSNDMFKEDEVPKSKKESKKKIRERIYKTPVYLARKIKRLFRLEEPLEEIMKWNNDKIFDLYESFARNPQIYEGETYKKMLIIISGNLDEAYKIANDVEEADLDADYYHEISKKLTVLNIKTALLKRFRPEQIARFGNNHILYPSLSKTNYYKIIALKCDQINKLIFDSKGINITYDKSVYDTMYNNGVFPTQGVRPLLSTITNILSSALPTFIFQCLINNNYDIVVKAEKDKMFTTISGKRVEVEIPTVLDKIREKIDDDTRYIIAVHELGHAIIYSILYGTPPKQICTDAVSPYNNGFVLPHTVIENKEGLQKKIQVCLAGRVAEEMVFGSKMASVGATADIEEATSVAWGYIGRNGFDGYTGYITQKDMENDFEIYNREIGEIAEQILKDAKQVVIDLLNLHSPMYKKMLSILLKKGKLNRQEFIDIAKDFGLELKSVNDGERLMLNYKDITEKFLTDKKSVDNS